MKPRFVILFHDCGHLLLQSETRPSEIAHILNYTGREKDEMTCSCEYSQEGGHDDCKHRVFLRELFDLADELVERAPKVKKVLPNQK